MAKSIKYIGLDVHENSIAISVVDLGSDSIAFVKKEKQPIYRQEIAEQKIHSTAHRPLFLC